MKLKNLLFCLGIIFYPCFIKSEDKLDTLDQKIKSIETLVVSMAQNMALQQELIHLLQKQTQVNLSIQENEVLSEDHSNDDDHRLTLRVPKYLMAKIDIKRKQRIGKISRNLWIIETLDEATRK